MRFLHIGVFAAIDRSVISFTTALGVVVIAGLGGVIV